MKEIIKNNFDQLKEFLKKPKVLDEKIPKYLQLKYTFIPIILVVIFTFYNIDTPVEDYIKHSLPHIVDTIFKDITNVGKAEYILIICIVIVLVRLVCNPKKLSEKMEIFFNKLVAYSGFMIATVAISGIVGQILKMIIGRARPKFFLQYGSHYFEHFHAPGYNFASMPSGHSITVAAMFLAFLYMFQKLKYMWYVLIVIFAGSRVIIGSHYPSDVIFGVAIGLYSTTYLYYWMKNRKML
ncbi:phosphatase [Francisella halioticida]|uniref:undecaprenyl-diphosphate phosphatase n=1 Tax=Francisella halioticida TaxID=549298 RepID=A0ABM6M0Y7_9GAMM|nr:lipid A 1-phosphatase LpxE [Francisella halioticida]ASG68636.1 phosphatase [Francisella halioticida]